MESEGLLTLGDIIKFMIYTLFVGASIGGISEQYAQIQKSVGAADRILDILEQPSEFEVQEQGPSVDLPPLQGNIEVKRVSFAYPTRPEVTVLNQIHFEIPAGQKWAVVGASGAGKSTLVQLLLGFYKPQSGSICFDNQTLNDLQYLRSQIALVPQEVILFGGTLYENILYGNPKASEEEVYSAAKQANAAEFIEAFPEQYQTLVGDRGIQLSGGQRQRIAIARAILKKPAILILDEATSALDSESEHLVQEALDNLMKNRTSLIIAHRLSTIKNADYLLVLEQGRIVEQGTPDLLLQQNQSRFAEMWKQQFQK